LKRSTVEESLRATEIDRKKEEKIGKECRNLSSKRTIVAYADDTTK
jgi:ubiquitin